MDPLASATVSSGPLGTRAARPSVPPGAGYSEASPRASPLVSSSPDSSDPSGFSAEVAAPPFRPVSELSTARCRPVAFVEVSPSPGSSDLMGLWKSEGLAAPSYSPNYMDAARPVALRGASSSPGSTDPTGLWRAEATATYLSALAMTAL